MALKARLAKLRATGATLSKLPFDEAAQLRNALRGGRGARRLRSSPCPGRTPGCARPRRRRGGGSRRWKRSLPGFVRPARCCPRRCSGERASSRRKPRSERPRGQQPGGAGHGRTQRLGLEERTEELNPPEDARGVLLLRTALCAERHRGIHHRLRSRSGPTHAGSSVPAGAGAVTARPRPWKCRRLRCRGWFDNTLYGISVWACFLFERYGCFRPLNRVGAWLSDRGLLISPGTLADSVPRFVPLFEPLADAILAHQNKSALRHADETTWRVQALRETGRSSRAWLWTSVSSDAVYFHIDPSRSAEAAEKLFAEALLHTVHRLRPLQRLLKKLARLLGGLVTLAWCWKPHAAGFYQLRGRPGAADGMVPAMDRADRIDLPPERGAAGSLQSRAQSARRRCSTRPRTR